MDEARKLYRDAIRMYAEPSKRDFWLRVDDLMEQVNTVLCPMHKLPSTSDDVMQSYYERQLRALVRMFNDSQARMRQLRKLNTESFKWYFITVGYDDKIITETLIRKYSQRIATSAYFDSCEYVNEKFRKDDKGNIYIHHHTHFLVKCDLPKSRLIDRVFATVKKVVQSKNFIDIKGYKDNVGSYDDKLKYIRGDKIESKMECVLMDREWRNTNNL